MHGYIGYPNKIPENEASFLSIKLSGKENYLPWAVQIKNLLEFHGLQNLIDPLSRPPPATFRNHTGWKKYNQLLKEWIFSSLTPNVIDRALTRIPTATGLWGEIKNRYEKTGLEGEYRTRDLLDSLGVHISPGKSVRDTFITMLVDKDSYHPWRDQMMEFLDLLGMKGFIDGTLRYPDPTGESEEEHVRRMYSEKWKRLDKKVMEWITDSLDDILNYMVHEMKTAKEMWDTLVTFFTGDTRTLSASLEDSHSHGEGVIKSIDIKLIDKENYQPWKDQMMAFLNSKRMKGFINGTFRDPDPKGESGEEHVRIYSAIGKRLHKQVMKWIMVALNDILYYMVEEMKSSKDVWDTLEIFFTTEKLEPLDSNSLPKLRDETTYIDWKEQTESFLVCQKMGGFINGTFRDPSKISRRLRQRDKAIVKVYSERWTFLDQRIMELIKFSLSDILHDVVKDLKSSKEIWHALKIIFTTGYPYNTPVYEAGFLAIKLSGKENYLPWAVQIKNLLEFHGLLNLIDPLSRPPPATFKNHVHWKKYNELFKGWIFSSLAINVIDETLTRIPTVTEFWGEIKNRYGPSDVEYTDLKGGYNHANYTLLYTGIMSGDLEVTTRELDTHGYDVELTEDGPTPLHVIIVTRKQNYEYFEKVLNHVVGKIRAEAGASTSTFTNPILVNLVNRDGRNTLHRAALVGNLHAAKRLVDKDPYLLFKEDNDECLPIHVAISTPHKDTFRYILKASKENINLLDNEEITKSFGLINPFEGKHGVRLLIAAIEAGYMEVAYQLIERKPDIAAENDGNSFRTPLHRIVENYDKYYSLPIRWRIFDQDAGMEFKATTDETLPPNQGTQNADTGDTWYSKAWMNLFKGFLMFLLNWIVYPFKVLRYVSRWICASVDTFILLHLKKREPDRNRLREDEVAHNKTLLVVRSICNQLRLQSTILEKRRHYHSAACVAACKDHHEALKEIAEHFPEVLLMEGDGYNLMQLAVKYRSEKVFNFLAYQTKVDTYFFKVKPKYGTSLLHYAGGLTPTEKLDQDSGAALQMRKEVKWYKKVEEFSLPGCNNEKNNMDETPMMVFRKEHADLKKRGEEWMKTVANSYIIVAALIITITFAALITVPGGSQQDSGDSPVGSPAGSPVASPVVNQNSIGLPVYIENNLFMVFVFSNVTSFCGATSALVMFLSILTSRYTEEDFINKLPWKLTIGLLALIVSLVGMLVAFGATLLLMLGHKDRFILVGIAFGIGLPVFTFIGFQVRMIWKIFR